MSLTTLTNGVVILQAVTFIVLSILLYVKGDWKLALAQAFLAVITWLVYG